MNASDENEIKKEFLLERVIFFSDAVFAIIITIMVLDVKLPAVLKYTSDKEAKGAFLQILPKLTAYIFTFIIVGRLWVRHLRIFSFLKDYDLPLVYINLLFLLSVSLYPFAESFAFNGSNFMDYDSGAYVYLSIIYFSTFTQTLLTGYLIKNKAALCLKNSEIEVVLKWKIMRIHYFMIPAILLLLACTIYFNLTHRILYAVIAAYFIFIRVLKLVQNLRSHHYKITMASLFGGAGKTKLPVRKTRKQSV